MTNLSNIRLIVGREVRDQLRDRRTLFMIAVLPIILYPLLGMSLLQVSQFMRDQPTRVLVVGSEHLSGSPALFEDEQFASAVSGGSAHLLKLHFAPSGSPEQGATISLRDHAMALVQAGDYEAALYFPPDFSKRLTAFREAISHPADNPADKLHAGTDAVALEVPNPEIIYNTVSDKSQIAFARLSEVLRRWTDCIGEDNLKASGISAQAVRPFSVGASDVADPGCRSGAVWSKILPVLLVLWTLTGAFYPAIDLCAGEKERGTLETLLSSPAQRTEIVLGKLLTVMLFSAVTAVLNLASVGVTACVVLSRISEFGLPSPLALAALLLALIPIAALFSALSLALAAFARSTKEGQYYLMPLLLIAMPLVILPMSPGVELNLGNSLIPLTGIVLLLRSMLEGDYWLAVQYLPAVAAVTFLACLMAIRWAVDQFNSEAVLFRESERFDVWQWLRRLARHRRPTPTVAMAVCCGVLILLTHFFTSVSLDMPSGFAGFVRTVATTQVLVIVAPALLLTMILTSSPRKTLLIQWPGWGAIIVAAFLALALHPVAMALQILVRELYPIGEEMRPALEQMQEMFRQADLLPLLLVIAVLPAVCEELAFRGFILSGFRHLGRKWRAIIYAALFFGLSHGILQQSLIASLLGVLLGFLAVQSGSLLPGIVFHGCHNALAVTNTRITASMLPDLPVVRTMVMPVEGGGCLFEWPLVVVGMLTALLLLAWFGRRPYEKSFEETQHEAIGRDSLNNPVEITPGALEPAPTIG